MMGAVGGKLTAKKPAQPAVRICPDQMAGQGAGVAGQAPLGGQGSLIIKRRIDICATGQDQAVSQAGIGCRIGISGKQGQGPGCFDSRK